jgi:hypothetical protein
VAHASVTSYPRWAQFVVRSAPSGRLVTRGGAGVRRKVDMTVALRAVSSLRRLTLLAMTRRFQVSFEIAWARVCKASATRMLRRRFQPRVTAITPCRSARIDSRSTGRPERKTRSLRSDLRAAVEPEVPLRENNFAPKTMKYMRQILYILRLCGVQNSARTPSGVQKTIAARALAVFAR